jgi:hypothetical protein
MALTQYSQLSLQQQVVEVESLITQLHLLLVVPVAVVVVAIALVTVALQELLTKATQAVMAFNKVELVLLVVVVAQVPLELTALQVLPVTVVAV